MDAGLSGAIRGLVQRSPVAALGTLHEGRPFVSMVPFAVAPDGSVLVIHVSHLASHTRDMQQHPDVSLLVTAALTPGSSPQELPRISMQGRAEPCDSSHPVYAAARTAYVERFPQSEPMFSFPDFMLFVIRPTSARFVGGFARAATVPAQELTEILRTTG